MAYQTASGWTFDTFFSSLESYEFLYNVFFFFTLINNTSLELDFFKPSWQSDLIGMI